MMFCSHRFLACSYFFFQILMKELVDVNYTDLRREWHSTASVLYTNLKRCSCDNEVNIWLLTPVWKFTVVFSWNVMTDGTGCFSYMMVLLCHIFHFIPPSCLFFAHNSCHFCLLSDKQTTFKTGHVFFKLSKKKKKNHCSQAVRSTGDLVK
jgi:hypothetical protein